MPNNLHATLFTCVSTFCDGQYWFLGMSGHMQGPQWGGVPENIQQESFRSLKERKA
jgi:hypothetical protein